MTSWSHTRLHISDASTHIRLLWIVKSGLPFRQEPQDCNYRWIPACSCALQDQEAKGRNTSAYKPQKALNATLRSRTRQNVLPGSCQQSHGCDMQAILRLSTPPSTICPNPCQTAMPVRTPCALLCCLQLCSLAIHSLPAYAAGLHDDPVHNSCIALRRSTRSTDAPPTTPHYPPTNTPPPHQHQHSSPRRQVLCHPTRTDTHMLRRRTSCTQAQAQSSSPPSSSSPSSPPSSSPSSACPSILPRSSSCKHNIGTHAHRVRYAFDVCNAVVDEQMLNRPVQEWLLNARLPPPMAACSGWRETVAMCSPFVLLQSHDAAAASVLHAPCKHQSSKH